MPDSTEKALAAALSDSTCFGQIAIRKSAGGFILCHRDDAGRDNLGKLRELEEATEIARWNDTGNYRPLKTAPNLRHGWSLEVVDLGELRHALDYFYPGRLAVLVRWKKGLLTTTPLRETLNRQSGMYRVAAKISDEQIEDLVGNFCRSNGGCLRTILWKRDNRGTIPSKKLPPEKFEPSHDQTGRGETAFPLLCQEPCNLLVAACRNVVKGEADE